MLDRLGRGDRDEQRLRVGVADVLGGEHDHPPRDEARVLAALEHHREVVDRRLHVARPRRLDPGRDRVVVRVAALVVEERPLAGRVLDVAHRRAPTPSARAVCAASSRIPSAVRASPPARPAISSSTSGASSTSELAGAAAHDLAQLLVGERLELVELHPREQRRVELEVRVLGRRADQRHEPVLDARQQRVLLGLVEAVDLVEEEDRPPPGRAEPLARPGEHLAHVRRPSPRRPTAPRTRRRSCSRRSGRASSCPIPGGPKRTSDGTRSASIASRSARPGPITCSWPTKSSSVAGRSRWASGAPRLEPPAGRLVEEIGHVRSMLLACGPMRAAEAC